MIDTKIKNQIKTIVKVKEYISKTIYKPVKYLSIFLLKRRNAIILVKNMIKINLYKITQFKIYLLWEIAKDYTLTKKIREKKVIYLIYNNKISLMVKMIRNKKIKH